MLSEVEKGRLLAGVELELGPFNGLSSKDAEEELRKRIATITPEKVEIVHLDNGKIRVGRA